MIHAGGGDVRVVDFVARLAQAWDGAGAQVLTDAERRALLALAQVDTNPRRGFSAGTSWDHLPGHARRSILTACRRAIEFGLLCAWVFGEGEGPRI